MRTHHTLIIGDSRHMEELLDESVHLVLTSPPYWQLKDYGNSNQIGFNDSYENYINNLNIVWSECYRVLHPGCRLCVNIGDQFARAVYYGRYKVIPIRTEIIKFCETVGFDYMGAIIWQKVTTTNTTGGATIMGSFPYPRNGIVKIDYEFILIFKKLGDPPKPTREAKEQSRLTVEEWNEYFAGHWNFSGERQDKHLAMFPEELPRRLIRMFTFVGDTVLDPFLGSGTTCLAAKNLKRNSIGYELNPECRPIIEQKLGVRTRNLFPEEASFRVSHQTHRPVDFARTIEKLPYVFRDKVHFDKKTDPRKRSFGSQVDGTQPAREEYFTVSRVVSPELIELTSGLRVRLLGVKTDEDKTNEAVSFLARMAKGDQIFLRFDSVKYDDKSQLLAYVYLRNKTLLNAHLIRRGLAKVDTSITYKFRGKFINYEKIGNGIEVEC
ncbi:MAG: DNA methylase N-4 [Ignavibacteriales bacterium CG07_land_8_20_14_0_80_59_12]|nr:MAG: DNA methylase N-4 [Ignavibacteriales bacterium CG07_land_8_20_14_0_80_59_12]